MRNSKALKLFLTPLINKKDVYSDYLKSTKIFVEQFYEKGLKIFKRPVFYIIFKFPAKSRD